jgi:hypothetical protein
MMSALMITTESPCSRSTASWELLNHLISNLLATSSICIMLNGEPGEIIQQQHGLHQGDPLSSMLFILVMDVLNSQIVKAGAEGLSR